jgi:hypothetical protein
MPNANSKRRRAAKTEGRSKMFKRKPKQVAVADPHAFAVQPTEMQIAQRMMGEFMASTVLSSVRSDLGQLVRDFGDFKTNVGQLNAALGEFREQAILPVKRELEYLRFNLGARTEDNVGAMSKLVHHLETQIDLLLRSRGVNPQARDAAGETARDKMGIPPDRPDYQTLEREGVKLVESGNAAADQASMQLAQVDKLRSECERLEHENVELRRLTLETGVAGPPEIPFKHGDFWVDSLQRRWCFTPPDTNA